MATKRQVFYSFHYENDVFRVQLIRNIGVVEGNPPVSANEWEVVKKKGDSAIEKWIDDKMKLRSCIIILVGEQTIFRPTKHYNTNIYMRLSKVWPYCRGIKMHQFILYRGEVISREVFLLLLLSVPI